MTVKKTQQEPTAKKMPSKEKLSTRELKDLMKPSSPILHRKRGGAWGN